MTDWTPVLVTDAPSNANLAVVRSLGRRGIPVGVCGFDGEFNLSFYSRYCQERIRLPSPTVDPSGFIHELATVLKKGNYPILFPTTERTIQLVCAYREDLPTSVRIPIADREALAVALDKERTVVLAQSLGVPSPATWCPTGPGEIPALLHGVRYPVIIKPRQTNFFTSEGGLQKAAYAIAATPAELEGAYTKIHAVVPRPLIQQLVPGVGAGIFSIWDRGTPLGWFAHRRLREEDPRGGRASAAAAVPCDPDLQEAATRLLKALGWHGVAMVEFRLDRERERFWLMEINGRFWGSLALALSAGVDFPFYLYRLARGEAVEVPASYAVGVVARDPVAELKHFFRVMLGPRPIGPAHRPSRLQTFREAATILHPSKGSFNWAVDDPSPGRREWLAFVLRILNRR